MSGTNAVDSVAAFCAAAQANDADGMAAVLAPDVELVSPLFGRMVFRGRDDVGALLTRAFGSLRGLYWREFVGQGQIRVAVSEARVAGLAISDAMVIELDDGGRVRRIRPHLRPWLALSVFALQLGARLGRHPGIIRRALKNGRSSAS